MYFMCRNIKFPTLPLSTLKHYLSFGAYFNFSETILRYWKVFVSYTRAAIMLRNFRHPSINYVFAIPLESISAFFNFNSSFVNSLWDASRYFPCNTMSWYFLLLIVFCPAKFRWVVDIIYHSFMVFVLHSIKKVHYSIIDCR